MNQHRTIHCIRQRTLSGWANSLGNANQLGFVACMLALVATFAWSYWPIMGDLFASWQSSDDYSAGQLVPVVAAFLLWRERRILSQSSWASCWWGGIALLLLAEMIRMYGLLSLRISAGRYSLVVAMIGLVLIAGGRQVLRFISWILLLLFLMFPLPIRAHNLISPPLQRIATTGSVFFMEVFGISMRQEGNVIVLGEDMRMAVAEACSGLRMLMAFVIVTAFIAYMVKRPRWQKGVLLVSSIPVAVVCNIVRIFATAVIMLHVGREVGEKFFHDFAGYVMMPVAVLLLFAEIWLMDRLVEPAAAHADAASPRRPRVKTAGKERGNEVREPRVVFRRKSRAAESAG